MLQDLCSFGMNIVRNIFDMTRSSSHASQVQSPVTPPMSRKRKCDQSNSSEANEKLFPLFSPSTRSPKSNSSLSSVSPPRKKANLTLRQGSSQNNKILRYLQPKRLLRNFETEDKSIVPLDKSVSLNREEANKENTGLELKVTLVRIEDGISSKSNNCVNPRAPKKYNCDKAAEVVSKVLENKILSDEENPCKRLGIPTPVCVQLRGCLHSQYEQKPFMQLESLYRTMVDADLQTLMLRACYRDILKVRLSPNSIHLIFNVMKNSADKSVLALGRNCLKKYLECYPPCTPKMKSYYIRILNSPESKLIIPSGLWSLRSLEYFESILEELEDHIDSFLNPSQLKEKEQFSARRKIVKPKRFIQSPPPSPSRDTEDQENFDSDILKDAEAFAEQFNCLSGEAKKQRLAAEEALKAMTVEEKTDHIFLRFETLVDILEWDLVVWLSNNKHVLIRDRERCPLVVLALWKPEADTGFDSILCRRLFSFYVSAWTLKFHPHHLKTLARLIGLVAEVTSASEPNIQNLRPYVGDGCENLGRKICDSMKGDQFAESRTKAISMIKPNWLKMLVSSNFLGVPPTMSSVMS